MHTIIMQKGTLWELQKSIYPGQTVHSAQADHGRNSLLLADFLCIKC